MYQRYKVQIYQLYYDQNRIVHPVSVQSGYSFHTSVDLQLISNVKPIVGIAVILSLCITNQAVCSFTR